MSDITKVDTSLYKLLTTGAIIRLANRLLLNINKDIVNHNERTAYISLKIAENMKMSEKCSKQNLVFLSLFHTIGFFREDFTNIKDKDGSIQYFSKDKEIMSKYIFGCYYLEYMTPIKEDARALETFNQPFNKDLKKYIYQEEYKSILYLSARISDFINKNPDKDLPENLNTLAPGYFDPESVEVFDKIRKTTNIVEELKKGTYKQKLFDFIVKIDYPIEEHIKMVKLLIYLLDFKSTVTMKHSINTSCYAVCIGIRMHLTEKELVDLFISAFLHDVGKIAIPSRILESPNKLSAKEREIMEKHVVYSKEILNGIINGQIVENVYRHHEKLNGTGYPNHVRGEYITLLQRILTVADITSALNDGRSYKEEYSKERVLGIIKEMTDLGELDPAVSNVIIKDFDDIQKELRYLQELLSVDFSIVIKKYNNYIFSDTDKYTEELLSNENIGDITDKFEDIDDVEEIEELEDLDEVEEL